jgi:hypothetical protein
VSTGLARRWLLRWPNLFVRVFVPDDRELGRLGEEVAACSLVRGGYRIEARGLRTREGEADLVVSTRSVRAVVEVKTARAQPVPRPKGSRFGGSRIAPLDLRWRPGFRCDARRIRRLRSLCRSLRADRVDLVEVFFLEASRRFRVLHHEDVRRPLTGRGLEGRPGDLR